MRKKIRNDTKIKAKEGPLIWGFESISVPIPNLVKSR